MTILVSLFGLVYINLVLCWSIGNILIWSWFMLKYVIYFHAASLLFIFFCYFFWYIYKVFLGIKWLLGLLVENHLTFPDKTTGIDLSLPFLLVYFPFFKKLSGLADDLLFLYLFRQSAIARSCPHHMEHLRRRWIISCIYSINSSTLHFYILYMTPLFGYDQFKHPKSFFRSKTYEIVSFSRYIKSKAEILNLI